MKNFSISLYAFHLRNIFTDSLEEVAPVAKNLWEKLAGLGEASLPLPELKNLRSHLICYDEKGKYKYIRERDMPSERLIKTHRLNLGSFDTELGYKILGNLQPFLLHDTCFADLTLLPESPDIKIEPSQLEQFHCQSLLPTAINPSIGQTIWIYGEIDKSDSSCESLAQSYAESLLKGSQFAGNLRLVSSSKLFGSLLFEYEAANSKDLLNLAKECHILIWINNNKAQTLELPKNAYDWLRDLLCSRHKMTYVYQQSRDLYRKCRQIYSELEEGVNTFSSKESQGKNRLKSLKVLLEDLPQKYLKYSGDLRDLKLQLTGFKTNAENYQICLRKIDEIGSGKESEVWQNFSKSVPRWQKQIEIDLEYLEPGKELFDRAIETTRGIVEIEQAEIDMKQAEIDRSLEKTIQIFGVGLGTGGIFATCYVVYGNIPWSWKPTKTFHPLVSSLFLTILIAVLAGLTARWFVNRKD